MVAQQFELWALDKDVLGLNPSKMNFVNELFLDWFRVRCSG